MTYNSPPLIVLTALIGYKICYLIYKILAKSFKEPAAVVLSPRSNDSKS